MFKKLIKKISEMQNKCKRERLNRYKCYRRYAYNLLRDKCIEYICKRDITSEHINLAPSYKVDIILAAIIKRDQDIFKYNENFPYRLINRELVRLDECYSV